MARPILGESMFVHFLEHETIELVGRRPSFRDEASRAFRMCLLLGERTVIPATAYWEDEFAEPLLDEYAAFRGANRLRLMGTAPTPSEYLAAKQEHYARDRHRYPRYFVEPSHAELDRLKQMWLTRERSTTADIAAAWHGGLSTGDVLFERLINQPDTKRGFDEKLVRVPELLERDAFIADFVSRALRADGVVLSPGQEQVVGQIIHRGHARSFLEEIGATAVLSGPTQASDRMLAGADLKVDLKRAEQVLRDLRLDGVVREFTPEALLEARESVEWEPVRGDVLARAAPTGAIWSPDDYVTVSAVDAVTFRDPLDVFRATCDRYTGAVVTAARKRRREEAELEGKRKGKIEIHGSGNVVGNVSGGHVGDRYYGSVVSGDVQVSGGRVQIGGRAVDLAQAPPPEIYRAIAEVLAAGAPAEMPAQLAAIAQVVDDRDDFEPEQLTAEIVEAFSGPRDMALTERLKGIATDIGHDAAVSVAASGLTGAVLVALQQLGLA